MFFQHVINVQANCQETFERPVFNVNFILKGAQVLDFGTLITPKNPVWVGDSVFGTLVRTFEKSYLCRH
jgi:hypothetical protein